jgi:hypothetical protein
LPGGIMRSIVLALCLIVSVSSCQLVEPQYMALSPEQVATLEAKLGDLGTANAELLRVEAEKLTGMQVEAVEKFRAEVLVKLTPPIQEIATAAGTTFVDGILANPTASGAAAAGLAALGAGLAVWRGRQNAGKPVK